jgi:hypothetical protein
MTRRGRWCVFLGWGPRHRGTFGRMGGGRQRPGWRPWMRPASEGRQTPATQWHE